MSALSSIFLGGAVLVIAVFSPIFLLAISIFIIGVSNRSDPDPRGARPIAAYSFSAAFLFLWLAVFAVVAALDSLINLIGKNGVGFAQTSNFAAATSPDHLAARMCVLGAIVLVLAGGAYLLHLRRGNALADTEEDPNGPTKRVMRSFVAFVCFASVLIFVVALVACVYEVFELISPSVFGGAASRTADWRSVLDTLVLVAASGVVFGYHQRFAPSGLRLFGRRTALGAPPAVE